ncbi:MAG: alpha/beta hydrolase family protein [Candidatus Acidiferrum sp.]
MFRRACRSQDFHTGFFGGIRRFISNFLYVGGLDSASTQARTDQAHPMHPSAPRRWSFFSLRRDFAHRRRFRRRLTNILLIPFLSLAVAYVITRPTGGGGFRLPKSAPGPTALGPSHGKTASAAEIPASENSPIAGAPEGLASPSQAKPPVGPSLIPTISGAYLLKNGPHKVTEVPDLVLHDPKGKQNLRVRIFYPNDGGPYPVIVFSRGPGAPENCCDALTRHWATYGYITLQPTRENTGPGQQMPGEETINFPMGPGETAETLTQGVNRSSTGNISLILESLDDVQYRVSALAGRVNTQQIGVGGDEMNTLTADAVVGAFADLPGRTVASYADPRVKAVLLVSPQEAGNLGPNSESWGPSTLPVLSLTGLLKKDEDKLGPTVRETSMKPGQAGDKYQVVIQGVGQKSILSAQSLLPGHAKNKISVLGYSESASLAFWDAYLKGDPKAKAYLQSGALADSSSGAVRVTRH